ncbi:MAG: glycerate kinase [Casimicrobiaceae bacterium]
MPTIVVAPDKFKGSLEAGAVAAAIAAGLRRVWPDADVRLRPMADGGDGTLAAILAGGGERRTRTIAGADGAAREYPYGFTHDGDEVVAIIEAASIVGITDPLGMGVPVAWRTTRGMGELIVALLDADVRRFMIGLGGSSTNDGGAGLLAALGLRLLDAQGEAIEPTLTGLDRLVRIEADTLDARLADSRITILSDVDNPLNGSRGATAVFGPQKGVQPGAIEALDATLAHFAALAQEAMGRDAANTPGAGAAGGLGFALLLAGGGLEPGAEVVADLVGLDAALDGADWLITGEGRSDAQTLAGKAPWTAARRARAAGVPATLLAGAVDASALPALAEYFDGCFALADGPLTLDDCVARAAPLLADRAEQLARLWTAARSG